MEEFSEAVLSDIRDKEDCINAWNSLIDSYIEDGILKPAARRWVNPFLKMFE